MCYVKYNTLLSAHTQSYWDHRTNTLKQSPDCFYSNQATPPPLCAEGLSTLSIQFMPHCLSLSPSPKNLKNFPKLLYNHVKRLIIKTWPPFQKKFSKSPGVLFAKKQRHQVRGCVNHAGLLIWGSGARPGKLNHVLIAGKIHERFSRKVSTESGIHEEV